jgi:IMP dehydrogenase/GMP reductase
VKDSVSGLRVGLTFDDFLLVPKFSDVKEGDSQTRFSRRITSAGYKESIPRDIQRGV